MAKRKLEGWDWWREPKRPPQRPTHSPIRVAMDLIDRDDLTPFSAKEQAQIKRWRHFGRPSVNDDHELDAFIRLDRFYQEWHRN